MIRGKNIIVIYADDMRADELRYTPAIRRLSRIGVNFTNAHQNQGMCRPARASFLRGQRVSGPNGHGVDGHDGSFLPLEDNSLAPWLAEAGYHNGVIGKYFDGLSALRVRPGWHFWHCGVTKKFNHARGYRVFNGREHLAPAIHQSHYFARHLLNFISLKGPWFMWFCTNTPHTPLEPTPRHADAWQWVSWPCENNAADRIDLKPSWIRALPEPDETDIRRMREFQRLRLGELLDLDHTVAAVWEYLVATGEFEHTTLIITSDNSNHLLEHRIPLIFKNSVYQESTRVPLIVVGPDFPAETVIDSPVHACVDTTATIVELAGARPTVPLDGISLRQIANHPTQWADRDLLCSRSTSSGPSGMPAATWIITPTRKLIRFDAEGEDRYEAYDLDNDPREFHNWANEPGRRSERDELERRLDNLLHAA